MNKYKNKFNLDKKNIFIFGGSGLIGSSICEAFSEYKSNLKVFDIKKKNNNKLNYEFIYFDVSELNSLNDRLNSILRKFGCPDVYINCSYPKTFNWEKSTHRNNTLDNLRKNVDMHLEKMPLKPTSEQLQYNGRNFPPNYLHESWYDYLYWDTELEN